MTDNSIKSFALSPEELSLIFGLVNMPDLGRNIMRTAGKIQDPAKMEERLKAAGHSLAARGLIEIGDNGKPILDTSLEQAVFPIAKFNCMFQISHNAQTKKDTPASIYIQNATQTFTAYSINKGVIHNIVSGDLRSLTNYIGGQFPEIGLGGGDETTPASHKLTLATLGKLIRYRNDKDKFSDTILTANLPSDIQGKLDEDIHNFEARGVIMFIDISNTDQLDTNLRPHQKSLLFLKNRNRSWLFSFDPAKDEQLAAISLVSRDTFINSVDNFITKSLSNK